MQARQTRQLNNTWNHFKRRRNLSTKVLFVLDYRNLSQQYTGTKELRTSTNSTILNLCFSEGSAARAIEGLTFTEANYGAAVEILQERFGRPQQIISAHMDQLLKVSPCTSDRPSSLRFVYDQICVHTRA